MGFALESGYTPSTVETIIDEIRVNINTQFGTVWTTESFVGTNWYKFAYAVAQRIQKNEIKASEVFAKLQQYFAITNERIQRPVATSPGLIEAFASAGFIASIKPMIDADAGKVNIALDLDSGAAGYAAKKLEAATIIKNSVVAGAVTQGAEVTSIVLSNGQAFDFKYHLPTVITPLIKLTTTLSENNQVVIESPDDVKAKLLANIAARYRLGKNFEPQRYFTTADAPWASQVLLEYKIGGGAWTNAVYDSAFNEKFNILLANVTLVEA